MIKTKREFFIFVISLLVVSLFVSCADVVENKVEKNPNSKVTKSVAKARIPVDATSSATPGVSSAVLDENHMGWQDGNCFDCHKNTHGSETTASCVVCHGYNGAPEMKARKPHTVRDSDSCVACHKDSHADQNYKDPNDCISCHKFEALPDSDGCSATFDTDVVVVGAGGGGLSAAAALARGGKKVVVLEQHHKVGGYMTDFTRGDYTFEASLHGFDGMDPGTMNVELFKMLGIMDKVKPVKEDVIYKSLYPDMTVNIPQGWEDYKNKLLEMFPHQRRAINKYYKTIDGINNTYTQLIAYTLGLTKKIPSVLGLLDIYRFSNMSLTRFLRKNMGIKDDKLFHMITQLAGFLGSSPDDQSAVLFLVMWNSYHRNGYYNFIGGSQAISDAMAEVIEENGGKVRVATRVTKIEVENKKATLVKTDTNVCFRPKYVISNASAPATMYKLIGREKIHRDDLNKYKNWKIGASMVVVYLGVNKDYTKEFGDAAEFMISTSYDPSDAYKIAKECKYDGPMAINNYTMVDPSNVKDPNKNVIVLSLLADYKCDEEWRWSRGFDAYKQYKNDLGNELVARAEKYLPGLSEHVEYMEVGTPQTMKKFTSNPTGTIFGWDHIISQVMFKRMNNTKLKGIDNLYLVGAWAFPGGGQSAVMNGGFSAARDILNKKEGETDGPVMKFFKWIWGLIS